MSNIEDNLRELLSEKAEQAPQAGTTRLPVGLRRRIRIRQAAVAAISTIVVAAAGLGATVAVRSLQHRADVPGSPAPAPAPSTTFLRDRGEVAYILAADTGPRDAWTFVAYRDTEEGFCLELRQRRRNASSGTCSFTVSEGRPIASGIAEPNSLSRPRIVFGALAKEATQVVIRLKGDSDVNARLLSVPAALGAPFNAFVALVPGDADGDIEVFDGAGNLLGREPLGPPPPGSEVGKPVPVLDANGRAVGLWPYEYVFGDPAKSPGGTSPPGRRATPKEIRTFALSPLRPRAPFRSWWDTRPDPSATDTAFLRWWTAYPPPTRARSSQPLPARTVSGKVWGVYVEVARIGSPSLGQAVDRLLDLGVRLNAINSDGTIQCDRGAAEALGTPPSKDGVVSVYFSSKAAADEFADGLDPPPVGVALVEIGCND